MAKLGKRLYFFLRKNDRRIKRDRLSLNFNKHQGVVKMKKIFLAALTAMALCSYSYAQDDDDDEYEDDWEE